MGGLPTVGADSWVGVCGNDWSSVADGGAWLVITFSVLDASVAEVSTGSGSAVACALDEGGVDVLMVGFTTGSAVPKFEEVLVNRAVIAGGVVASAPPKVICTPFKRCAAG